MSAQFRPEVYAVLECLDAGREIPEPLRLWLPLCEVEGLAVYTTTPEDLLPSSYPLAREPDGIHLALTTQGREALRQRHLIQEGGAS